ncbi:right-handed parallel beta-helix repeat-containing protein [Puniceicoccaceae bacterium K14]|nr:right-handed parallel beta-helix repeat-containing protein [Puniceicoccaceae bacterium K14]
MKTLKKLNSLRLKPGDRVFFRCGRIFEGQLRVRFSGKNGSPIVFSSYGDGERPIIKGSGNERAAILLENVDNVTISKLGVTNSTKSESSPKCGILISLLNFGDAENILIENNLVFDVNGSLKKWDGLSAGIAYYNHHGKLRSRFVGLKILNNVIRNVDRDGIKGRSDYCFRDNWYPNLNVQIEGNTIENVGGDGIVPYGCDSAVVQWNIVRGARMRTTEAAAGIWPFSCDETLIQYNDVSGVKGCNDGQGFDADYNCRNTVIQFNYSHNNDGGFILICNTPDTNPVFSYPEKSIGNEGTIIRYNVSYNDGTSPTATERGPIIVLSGRVENVSIYNNFVYNDKVSDLIMINSWGGQKLGLPSGVTIEGNVFYASDDIQVSYNMGYIQNFDIGFNAYAGNQHQAPIGENVYRIKELPNGFLKSVDSITSLRIGVSKPPPEWRLVLLAPKKNSPIANDFSGNLSTKEANEEFFVFGPWF